MPKILCCICSRRTNTNKQRTRIGTPSVWPLVEQYAAKINLDMSRLSRDDFICKKCYSTVSHYAMKDRGPNKKVRTREPIVSVPIITKEVLRGCAKSVLDTAPNNNVIEEETPISFQTVHTEEVFLEEFLNPIEDVDVDVVGHTGSTINNVVEDETPISTESVNEILFDEEFSSEHVYVDVVDHTGSSISNITTNNIVLDNETPISFQIVHTDEAFLEEYLNPIEDVDVDVIPTELPILIEDITETDVVAPTTSRLQNIRVPRSELNNSSTMAKANVKIQGTKSTQSRCFICGSVAGRRAIPWVAIQQVWLEKKCYVSSSNRTCLEHLTEFKKFTHEALQMIEITKQVVDVGSDEFAEWLHKVTDLPKLIPYNFENDGIQAECYKMFFGITKDNFDDLVQYLPGKRNTTTRSVRSALAMFLMLLRNNTKQELIAFNFGTTQQLVSKTIAAVLAALDEHFVPKNLGYHHITRDEALQKHSIQLTSKVLKQSEDRICLIADCTYNYIEKPSDFILQRKTFSLHKSRNLLKPLYIVFPTGYILEAAGPYFCDAKNIDRLIRIVLYFILDVKTDIILN